MQRSFPGPAKNHHSVLLFHAAGSTPTCCAVYMPDGVLRATASLLNYIKGVWVCGASSQIDLVYLRQHNTCTPAPYSVHLAILDPRTRHTLLRTSPSCRERAVWRHSTRLCVPPVPGEPRGLAGLEPHSQPRRCGGKGRRAAWAQPRRRRRRRWCRQLAAQDSVCRLLPAKQVPGW